VDVIQVYKIVDHTADIGVSVTSKNLKGLFVSAAKGMLEVALGGKTRKARKKTANITVNLSAVDPEQLLVKWLSEVLYLLTVKNQVAIKFEISDISGKSISAELLAVYLSPEDDRLSREIKAVTYHNLAIKKSGGHFKATVIFDI